MGQRQHHVISPFSWQNNCLSQLYSDLLFYLFLQQRNPMTPKDAYLQAIKEGRLKADPAQAHGVELTQELYQQLMETPVAPPSNGLFGLLKKAKKEPVKGLYFWGGVGRGKTMIIDMFFDLLPFSQKKRIHFNHFMQDMHQQLDILPKTPDPLKVIANNLARELRLIYIDEFHVDDIADAMILAGLLEAIFAEGITLVTTSNTAPDELYKNGLQRQRFLPVIELLKTHTIVYKLDKNVDYRARLLEQQGTYHVVAPHESWKIMESCLNKLANTSIKQNVSLCINQRDVRSKAHSDTVVWFEFSDICQTPRSSADYIVLARTFQTMLVSNIPPMGEEQNDIAQRFIQLIDALYDHKVKFFATALAEPTELYRGESLKPAFERTISRLLEMRSDAYLSKQHTAE